MLLSKARMLRLIEGGTSIPEADYYRLTEKGIMFNYLNGQETVEVIIEDRLELGELFKRFGVIDDFKQNGSEVAMFKNVKLSVISGKGVPAEYDRSVEYKIKDIEITPAQALDICVSLEIDRVNKMMGNTVTNKSAKIVSMQFNHLKVAEQWQ